MPVMHLIAGPNGSGKTLLYECLIGPRNPALPFVNPGAYAAGHRNEIQEPIKRADAARRWADEQRAALMRAGKSFITETVFSHSRKVTLLKHARSLGFEVVMYVIGSDEPRKHRRRASRRSENACTQDLIHRCPRTLEVLRRAVRLADLCFLFDGADITQGGPRLIASISQGQLRMHTILRPRWLEKVLVFSDS